MAVYFSPGSAKTPKVVVKVPIAGIACSAELYLGPDANTKTVTSGMVNFNSTGSDQNLNMPINLPPAVGTYHVYLDIYVGGTKQTPGYQGVDDVLTITISDISITW